MKAQEALRDDVLRRYKLLYLALERAVDMGEELGAAECQVSLDDFEEALVKPGHSFVLEVFMPGTGGGAEAREVRHGGLSVLLVPREPDGSAKVYSVREAYRRLFSLMLGRIAKVLKECASKTAATGVEYSVIVPFSEVADVVILEGGYMRVDIPFVRSVISIHTHPGADCLPSHKDLESCIDVLVSGGLFAGPATLNCVSGLLRTWLITEEEYIEMVVLKNRVGRAKSPADYARAVAEFRRKVRSVEFITTSY